MANANKITKKMVLEAIKAVAEAGNVDFGAEVSADDVYNFADTMIAQLDAKAVKAKEKANEKKAAGDVLKAEIQSILTDEYQTLDQIVSALDVEDVTNAKASYRVNALCKEGLAHKSTIDVDGRKLTGYAAGPAPDEE